MTKKLKIRFVKLERALVAQQLEIEGIHHFVENPHTQFSPFFLELQRDGVCIAVRENSVFIKHRIFNDNAERDEYLKNVIKWISEEQFATGGKLEIGKMCEVSDDNKDWRRRILLAVLPKTFLSKYIAEEVYSDLKWSSWEYARPLNSFARPKVDRDVYTWEMEVKDER